MTSHYDALIIGTGQAGPPLAERLTQAGMKTAIVERKLFGGTCVNVGCIPTKTLVASARAAYMARCGAEFGVLIDSPIHVDMKRVKARKDEISGASNQGVTQWLEGMDNLTIYRGHARFVDNHAVEVNEDRLEAEKIFIDVGARARVPENMLGIDTVDYLTNSTIMELDYLPEHLVIIGGSYIGLEFAQMYRRFGSRVTVVEMGERLVSREDEDTSAAVQEILEKEGVQIRLNAECIAMEKQGKAITVQLDCKEPEKRVTGSHLLLAVGRQPNTHDLGLEHTDVVTNTRGFIQVDEQLQTTAPGVWAMGEVNGRGAFTHTSYNDFEIVAANLLNNDPRRVNDRILCYGLFIDPPLGRIGMSEAEVRASGRKALMGKRPMSRVGRARERSETQGFIKILVAADTQEILGAVILGINGDEVIHCLLDMMYAKQPYTVIQRAVHIHPTVAELIPTVLGALQPLDS